jgi:hypothetical protein
MEQQLSAGWGEGQIAEFVEDDGVEAGEMICDAALPTRAGLGLELVDGPSATRAERGQCQRPIGNAHIPKRSSVPWTA